MQLRLSAEQDAEWDYVRYVPRYLGRHVFPFIRWATAFPCEKSVSRLKRRVVAFCQASVLFSLLRSRMVYLASSLDLSPPSDVAPVSLILHFCPFSLPFLFFFQSKEDTNFLFFQPFMHFPLRAAPLLRGL